MPPKIKRVSKYALGKTLGQGTFGKVKYAVNTETNSPVAMKIMDKQKIKAAKLGPQIKKEIRVMQMVTHPTCIKLIEVLASQENIFLVLELVSGGELFDRVVTNGRFSENEARKYFTQLIEGLEHCHSLGVCHRDLKPENLLLDAHGGLKITDFGLASINETPDVPQILHTPCGTPNYVAPEVLMEKGYDGQLADIWSAGVILYLLVSGFLPFDEAQMVDLFRKIVVADYQYPSWLSHEVQTLIGKMLEPNTDRRATIQDIKRSAWYRGEIQSTKRKFQINSDNNSAITDQTNGSFDEETEDYTHVLHYDDDQLIFGPTSLNEASPEFQNLILTRQASSKLGAGQDHGYQFKKDQHGNDLILVGDDQWKPIRDWFYSKYPGKRSVIDDRIRRQRRAARKAAQAGQAGSPTGTDTTSVTLPFSPIPATPQESTTTPTPTPTSNPVLGGSSSSSNNVPFATTTTPNPTSTTNAIGQTPAMSRIEETAAATTTTTSSTSAVFQSKPETNEINPPGSSTGVLVPTLTTALSNDGQEQEPEQDGVEPGDNEILAPKQLNAFDLINMVSGQSVNNMLLFNAESNDTTSSNSNNKPNTAKDDPDAALKSQLKQTQTSHQQQSFTQFTSKCPTALLIRRLDYVLLHIPNVKYRINYRKCHINAVWTNSNQHQVHEFIEIYSLNADLHMVRCQRMAGSGIAHGEFYRIFKENVKFLEAHSNLAQGQPAAGANATATSLDATTARLVDNNDDILISTPVRPQRKDGVPNSPNSGIYITADDIETYLSEWTQDVGIYKDSLLKAKLLQQQQQVNDAGDIQPTADQPNMSPSASTAISPSANPTAPAIAIAGAPMVGPDDEAPSPRPITANHNNVSVTSPTKPSHLTDAQMEYGLNTFRSLTVNSKSITMGTRSRGTSIPKIKIDQAGTTADQSSPVNVVGSDGINRSIHLQRNPKESQDLRRAESSSSSDDDDSSSSDEDDN